MSMSAEPWAADVVLSDGATVHFRPISPDDGAALSGLHVRQSPQSQYFRYFTPKPTLSEREIVRFTNVDGRDRGALVVFDGETMIAWASYERLAGQDEAEVAFQVDDAHAGRGLATLLLEHLGAMASSVGVRRFVAQVLPANRTMGDVFARSGWTIERQLSGGVVDFLWSILDTASFRFAVEAREHAADARSMKRFLDPRSIAVIGASDRPGSIGKVLMDNALASGAISKTAVTTPVAGRRSV